jgi:hypothetical protein
LSLEIISTTMLIAVISILDRFQEIPLIVMVIPMVIHIIIIGYPLILKAILKNLLILKRFSMVEEKINKLDDMARNMVELLMMWILSKLKKFHTSMI